MACRPTEVKYGYEDSRFERDVDENFHCSICYNVLKEPRTCRNNDHVFCLDCIAEHLKVNSQTCPECNEHLSVETLRRPRRLNNYLSKLKINCDYASRGCPEYVCVEDLETHVENCGFAPVLCSNEECGMEINKQERVHHETAVCEYRNRRVKCHDCGQIQEIVRRLEGSVKQLNEKVDGVNEKVEGVHEKIERLAQARVEMKKEVKDVNEKVEGVSEKVEGVNERVKLVNEKVEGVNEKVEGVNEKVERLVAAREEMRKEVKGVKENLSKVNKDVDEVKVMMSQMLEKLKLIELFNKLPSPTGGMMNTQREDILITGGGGVKSTEIYSWEKNGWFKVSEMSDYHLGASSFIYNDQLFVVGGDDTKSIETLNLSELPLKWLKFAGELPYECGCHQTVVHQQRIIHIGGFNHTRGEKSNVISELQLTSPCTMKELCQMPEPRDCHGAEIFEDKVLILGGRAGFDNGDSVLEFDLKKNQVKKISRLPRALQGMATVRWRNEVVVLGGRDREWKSLNDVYMYDCKTGKITALPPMLEKRDECCAVITGDTIVVMGGKNENFVTLSSVECFTMGGSTWKYLPAMNKTRHAATAQVLPSLRKYV